jgi:topoisomerase-4 subunit A
MARGQGVTLQRYRDGGLADVTTLQARGWPVVGDGRRERAGADREGDPHVEGRPRRGGRLPPQGFPRDNKF